MISAPSSMSTGAGEPKSGSAKQSFLNCGQFSTGNCIDGMLRVTRLITTATITAANSLFLDLSVNLLTPFVCAIESPPIPMIWQLECCRGKRSNCTAASVMQLTWDPVSINARNGHSWPSPATMLTVAVAKIVVPPVRHALSICYALWLVDAIDKSSRARNSAPCDIVGPGPRRHKMLLCR